MSEQYDFRIPAEEVKEDDLEQIVKEFSAPEYPEVQEEIIDAPVKKGASVLKVIAIVCASLILVAAIGVGAVYWQWNQRYQASLPDQKSAEAFSLLFKDPEWGML